MRVGAPLAAALAVVMSATVGLPSRADASAIRRLAADELRDGADLIVEGRVIRVESRWNAAHSGFETITTVAVERAEKGIAPPVVRIVTPGGIVGEMRHVIVGMPTHREGEHARFFLRGAGEGAYRVYGWQQGVWPARANGHGITFAPPQLGASEEFGTSSGEEPPAQEPPGEQQFAFNGMLWKPEQIPVEYVINEVGSDDVAFDAAKDAIFASFAAWQDVPCSSLTFSYQGETDLGMAVDGTNVILWIESDWIYGEEAAGATSLFFVPGETPTADVAFNGENFSWDIGPISTGTSVQDVQGVLTHELGHFSGLSHTESSLDTMYFSWTPWQSQRPLSADDKLGLCALYPQSGSECTEGENCSDGSPCIAYEAGALCSPPADPTGTDCNYDRIDCESFCLFTATNLSSGYCSEFCEVDDDCPDRFACNEASAGANPVKVCFKDPTSRRPDAGPVEGSCVTTSDCAEGQHCADDGFCQLLCREDFDCPSRGDRCTSDGRCVAAESGGCGCSSSGSAPASLAWLLAAYAFLRRRRYS